MNMKRWTCVALAMAFVAVTNCALAQTWLASGPKIWTQPDSDDFSTAYTNGATATFLDAGSGTVTIDAGGVTPGAVVVNSTANYTFTGGSIGGTGSLTKMGSGYLNIANANSFSGGVFINAGTLRFEAGSTSAGLGDAGNVVTFTGNGTIYLTQVDLIFPQGIAVNGVSAVLSGNAGRDIAFNNALTGSGTLTLNAGGNPLNVNLNSTANTFSGNIRLTEYDCALTMNSLADSEGSQMIFGSSSKNKYATFTYGSGAIVPLVLNERQIVFGSGYGSIKISNNASGANTITINKDVINNGTGGNRTFTLGGSNTGNNTFAGAITNGSSYVTSLSKADAGTWILSGNNTYSGATTVSAGTLVLSGNNTYSGVTTVSGGTLSISSIDVVANANPLGKSTAAASNLLLADSTTLRYTGGSATCDRLFTLSTTANNGTVTLDASGTGPVNFNNTGSVAYGTAASGKTRTLVLTGSNTGTNTLAAVIGDNGVSGYSSVLVTKSGTGTWVLSGANTYSGATAINGGTLLLDMTAGSLNSASTLTLGGGNFSVKGKTGSFTSAQTLGNLTLTAGTGSAITLDPNAGTSTTLTLGTTWMRGAGSSLLIDTSSANTGIRNVKTASAITGTGAAVNGLLNYVLVKDATGIGFGVQDGSFNIVRDAGTVLTTANCVAETAAVNFTTVPTDTGYSSAVLTLDNVAHAANTLSIDSTGGGTLDLGGSQTLSLTAKGILMTGTGNYTIRTGTVGAAASEVIIHQMGSGSLTISSLIGSTTASLSKFGTGVLVLTALNTYTGGTTLNDGTIRVGATVGSPNPSGILGGVFNNGITIANKPTAVFDLDGYTAYIKDLKGGGSLGGNVTLGSGTLYIVNPSGGNSYDGTISGLGNVQVDGSSGWNTTGAHTYTGITTIGPGNLGLNASILTDGGTASGIGQSSSASGNLVFNGSGASTPALRYSGAAAASTDRQFTLAGGGALGVTSTGAITWSYTGAVTYSGTGTRLLAFTGDGAGLGTLAADVDDNGSDATSLAKYGTSNWTLTNTGCGFTGAITLGTTTTAGGTLSYASAGGANAITFSQTTGSATLSYIGSTDKTMSGAITASALTTGTITFDASGTGAINYSNPASMGNSGGANVKKLILSGSNTGNNILAAGWNNNGTGAATLTKNGAGTWVLSGANTYSGTTTVNAGTLRAGIASAAGYGAFGTNSAVTVANDASAVLDLNGFNTTIGSLAGVGPNGSVTLGSATLTVGTNKTSTTFAGVISGTGNLVKVGTGTNTLSGVNLYTGTTMVNMGTVGLTTNNCLSADSSVVIATGAKMYLNFAGTNTIMTLNLGGSPMVKGVYDANTSSPYLTGTGALKVTSGPVTGTLIQFF